MFNCKKYNISAVKSSELAFHIHVRSWFLRLSSLCVNTNANAWPVHLIRCVFIQASDFKCELAKQDSNCCSFKTAVDLAGKTGHRRKHVINIHYSASCGNVENALHRPTWNSGISHMNSQLFIVFYCKNIQ